MRLENMKIVIVGGVAGGATTVARLRRMNEQVEIVLLERGKYISYANCGLPYYIGGVIKDRNDLFVRTAEDFGKRFNVDVRTQTEVVSIQRKDKTITIKNRGGIESVESYDKLLLATGARPICPPIPGIDLPGIFTLRNVDDTDRIKRFVENSNVERVAVVGAGFIGLEMAENLQHAGAKVSVIERENQVMAPLDYSMASLVHEHLIEQGVDLYLEHSVEAFEAVDNKIKVKIGEGHSIIVDLVVLSMGVRPENQLALEGGLAIGKTGGIIVNEYLQTNDESIYAIGDVIEYPHPITEKPWLNLLAGPANRQGRIVADNLLGAKIKYEGSIGTSIAKVFDLTVASTGVSAKTLIKEDIPYHSSITHGFSHAGYYPGAMPMSLKLLFSPDDGRVYGAQIIGYEGVDKRIDQVALVIKNRGTIYNLTHIEHAYAPPYSEAKDPVIIAGYVAENILSDKIQVVSWREFHKSRKIKDAILLDIRTNEEQRRHPFDGATHIPLQDLRNRLNELPKDRPIYTFCTVGLRGYLAYRILIQHGFEKVKNLNGGLRILEAATVSNSKIDE